MQKVQLIHVYRITLFLSSLALTCWLWSKPIILFTLLLVLFFEMNRTLKWKLLKTSTLVALLGPIAEILVVITSDAWHYQHPQIYGIPLWLAPLWGLAGLFFMALAVFVGETANRD